MSSIEPHYEAYGAISLKSEIPDTYEALRLRILLLIDEIVHSQKCSVEQENNETVIIIPSLVDSMDSAQQHVECKIRNWNDTTFTFVITREDKTTITLSIAEAGGNYRYSLYSGSWRTDFLSLEQNNRSIYSTEKKWYMVLAVLIEVPELSKLIKENLLPTHSQKSIKPVFVAGTHGDEQVPLYSSRELIITNTEAVNEGVRGLLNIQGVIDDWNRLSVSSKTRRYRSDCGSLIRHSAGSISHPWSRENILVPIIDWHNYEWHKWAPKYNLEAGEPILIIPLGKQTVDMLRVAAIAGIKTIFVGTKEVYKQNGYMSWLSHSRWKRDHQTPAMIEIPHIKSSPEEYQRVNSLSIHTTKKMMGRLRQDKGAKQNRIDLDEMKIIFFGKGNKPLEFCGFNQIIYFIANCVY